MRFLLLGILLISSISFAETEIYLSEINYYLDDFNQKINPEVGLEIKGVFLDKKIQDDLFWGSGYVAQFSDYGGTESLNGWFSEIIYKINYNYSKNLQITAGWGWIDNRQAYGGALDNHISVGMQYRVK